MSMASSGGDSCTTTRTTGAATPAPAPATAAAAPAAPPAAAPPTTTISKSGPDLLLATSNTCFDCYTACFLHLTGFEYPAVVRKLIVEFAYYAVTQTQNPKPKSPSPFIVNNAS